MEFYSAFGKTPEAARGGPCFPFHNGKPRFFQIPAYSCIVQPPLSDGDHRDIVVAARLVGGVHQTADRLFRTCGLYDGVYIIGLYHVGQTVRTDNQRSLIGKWEIQRVTLHRLLHTQGPGDEVLARMVLGFALGELAFSSMACTMEWSRVICSMPPSVTK